MDPLIELIFSGIIISGVIWTFLRNRSYLYNRIRKKSIARVILIVEIVVGLGIGWFLTLIDLHHADGWTITGLPISIGGWNDGKGWTYISPFAIFALVLNPLFGVFLVQLYGTIRSYKIAS